MRDSWTNYLWGLIEDDKGQLSTTRLILWVAFIVSTYKYSQVDTTPELIAAYGGLWVISYIGGRLGEAKGSGTTVQVDNVEKVDARSN